MPVLLVPIKSSTSRPYMYICVCAQNNWLNDSVDRDILISKLEFYGIRGKFNELIKSYLNNRYINTRQNFNLYQPQANLILYQKGVYYSGVKVFNNLSPNIKNLFSDVKRFKLELGKYLHLKSFYTLEEYYDSCKA